MKSASLRLFTIGVAIALALATTSEARANGDGVHAQTLAKEGRGLLTSAFGVGLAGRVPGAGVPVPVTTANIAVTGLPAGAVVERAYLYWITFGDAGSASITLDGNAVTGSLIGTSDGTCWTSYPTFKNFTYRADVTAAVNGNRDYVLTGFPSGTATADTQGATLFLVYRDPALALNGGVVLYDGAITVRSGSSLAGEFTGLALPTTLLSARFLVSVGDGQSGLDDGGLSFEFVLQPPPGGQHWSGSAGSYWDVRSYDVLAPLVARPKPAIAEWNQSFSNDCLAFAYSALVYQSPEGTGDAGASGPDDAGLDGSSGGDGSSGSSGGSGSPADGGPGEGSASSNADPPEASDGCGCGTTGTSRHAPTAAAVVAALLFTFARRRRRT